MISAMDVILRPKAEVWKGRGKPRIVVPDMVLDLLRATYRTGKVGTLALDEYGELDTDSEELLRLLRIGARRLDKRLATQRDEHGVRFELRDKVTRKKAA